MQISSSTRQQISLDGQWDFTPQGQATIKMPVPGFWANQWEDYGTGVTGDYKILSGVQNGEYRTTFAVSASMAGQHLWLAFESVNFVADFYVNGNFVATHKGAYVPFRLDITPYVSSPSSGNVLRVVFRHTDSDFLTDAGFPAWPVGLNGHQWDLGITQDVALLSLPEVYVDDAYIKTSVRNSQISVEVTITNSSPVAQSVQIDNRVQEFDGTTVLDLGSRGLTLQAHESQTIRLSQSWQNPHKWWPHDPHLYFLRTTVLRNNAVLDENFSRFGFREISTDGNKLFFNGIRYNLFGDTIVWWSQNPMWQYLQITPETWRQMVPRIKAANINTVRMHEEQHPRWFAEIADELGLLLIAESAAYSSDFIHNNSQRYIDNCRALMEPWIKRDRNHPSIVMWDAENEMVLRLNQKFSFSQLKSLGDAITPFDDTRPILYEGDEDLNGLANTYNYHYIFGWPDSWPKRNKIYRLDDYLHPTKITCTGEFGASGRGSTVDEEQRAWRNALLVRGYRHAQFVDMHPYHLEWLWTDEPSVFASLGGWHPDSLVTAFMKNSYCRVAVFDKAYDELGPPAEITLPAYSEGETADRTLVIYNDEFADENVVMRWEVHLDGVITAVGTKNYTIPLGSYVEDAVKIPVPYVPASRSFTIWYRAFKNGESKFLEKRTFWVNDIGLDPDIPATAHITVSPQTGEVPLMVHFDGQGSNGNLPLQYHWDFDIADGWTPDVSAAVLDHTYEKIGNYTAGLIVRDPQGDVDTAYVSIQTHAPSPEIQIAQLEAETMAIHTNGAADDNGWLLWSNGYIADQVNFSAAALHRFVIRCRGSQAFSQWPIFELRIDGTRVGQREVNSGSYTDRVLEIDLPAGSHQVAVAFVNDATDPATGADRNLWVDRLTISQLAAVPVELVSFSARRESQRVRLEWHTASETNNYGFFIERRSSGAFETIGFVPGHGTTTAAQHYSFIDGNAPASALSYRLRQTDTDGGAQLSAEAHVIAFRPDRLTLTPIYPNPIQKAALVKINYAIPEETSVHIEIVDLLGRRVKTLFDGMQTAGAHEIVWQTNDAHDFALARGVYFVQVTAGKARAVRKLVLLGR